MNTKRLRKFLHCSNILDVLVLKKWSQGFWKTFTFWPQNGHSNYFAVAFSSFEFRLSLIWPPWVPFESHWSRWEFHSSPIQVLFEFLSVILCSLIWVSFECHSSRFQVSVEYILNLSWVSVVSQLGLSRVLVEAHFQEDRMMSFDFLHSDKPSEVMIYCIVQSLEKWHLGFFPKFMKNANICLFSLNVNTALRLITISFYFLLHRNIYEISRNLSYSQIWKFNFWILKLWKDQILLYTLAILWENCRTKNRRIFT